MPEIDKFTIDVPDTKSKLNVTIHVSPNANQQQMLLRPNEPRLQLNTPMVFWADCTLRDDKPIVAVGWAQTMTMALVEFCYSTLTHGCIADLDLTPCPCADGGYGLWYGGVNTAALQFLGTDYDQHERDLVYFGLMNDNVRTGGGTEFEPKAKWKRVILSDSPFVNIPEVAGSSVPNRNLPATSTAAGFSMGHGSPRSAAQVDLLNGSQLECVKARYRFTTQLCALRAQDASLVPNLTQAPCFARFEWGADYCANITGTQIRKSWHSIGPLKIVTTGAKPTKYDRVDGKVVRRCSGAPCNQGVRRVGFDYRLLQSF